MKQIPERPTLFPFQNALTPAQTRLGWCYLPLHIFAWPFLLSAFAEFSQTPITEGQINLIYYGVGFAFVLVFMWKFLRANYEMLCDRLLFSILAMLTSIMVYYALSYLAALILLLAEGGVAENPNNSAVVATDPDSFAIIRAIGMFIAPVVEEVLFRGIAFGSLRKYSRFSAYVISIALFCAYHVWQYVYATGEWSLLIYAVQYIPAGFVLARTYERTGSIWTSIFFHMGVNVFSFAYLAQNAA